MQNWENIEEYVADQARVGPGEQGKPVQLPKDELVEREAVKNFKECCTSGNSKNFANGYNAYISDLISLNRSMKDIRHPQCKQMQYHSKLPMVSVIFPMHEESYKEIIIVDDFSEKPFLKKPFEDFLKHEKIDHIVKVLRTKKREGLIRARQLGAEKATGEILVFLDSHSEANYNWLPPLIDPIVEDYRTVVCPFVDVIDCDTYEIRPQDDGARGSFDWAFNYKRLPLTRKDRENPTKPFPSPVMAGGYFAISTNGSGNSAVMMMDWTFGVGEQYELSFKNAGVGDFISRNYRRVAEVWMDEYKHNLYKHRATCDISRKKACSASGLKTAKHSKLRSCKDSGQFDQDKYYPAVEPKPSTSGELRNKGAGMCVDTQFKQAHQRFGLRKCISDDPNGGGEQNLRLTRWHDIRPLGRSVCFDASSSEDKAPVVLFDWLVTLVVFHKESEKSCCVFSHSMKGNQLFKFNVDTGLIFHPASLRFDFDPFSLRYCCPLLQVSGQCLSAEPDGSGFVFMQRCDENAPTQKWVWQVVDRQLLEERQNAEAKERD
ncbi:glycosyltransferase, group 2 family protein [Ostertagia ostertagi]